VVDILPQPYPTYVTAPKRVYENYLSKQSLGLGATMIVAGILCIIFNAVSIGLGALLSKIIGYGIWGGIWVRLSSVPFLCLIWL